VIGSTRRSAQETLKGGGAQRGHRRRRNDLVGQRLELHSYAQAPKTVPMAEYARPLTMSSQPCWVA
jgi:hypothetical protein